MQPFDYDKQIYRLQREIEINKLLHNSELERRDAQLVRFSSIINIEAEIDEKKQELSTLISRNQFEIEQHQIKVKELLADLEAVKRNEVESRNKELQEIQEKIGRTLEEKESALKNLNHQHQIKLESEVKENYALINKQEETLKNLNDKYRNALETYKSLRAEVTVFESKLDLIEFGIFEPVYDFEKSEDYRSEQNIILDIQKEMIQSETAATCSTKWTIDGSESKGRASTKRYIKLILRAFNGECNALIAKVKWNNINQTKERVQKSFEALNKLGESQAVSISREFLNLKVSEILLEYEYQLKKQNEKEAMRAVQEEIREEEKVRREMEQAQRQAEKEEETFQKALLKAREESRKVTGELQEQLSAKILLLEQEIQRVQEKRERALSMAQQTKRGHVYVISNVGSFGEDVYKIGMTRRLEPIDRVNELGSASVPFQFDVHAMIYSDEARTLESELHKAFANKKVNMLNYRKEFFRVSLEEILNKVKELGFEAEFTIFPEAMQYRETLAILDKLNSHVETISMEDNIAEKYPDSLN